MNDSDRLAGPFVESSWNRLVSWLLVVPKSLLQYVPERYVDTVG